jgi:hypothetical protein
MRPGDHPEFFRFPAPEGRSRESSIRIDREGRFWHEGELVKHPGMQKAFATWIDLHPDDGRFILNNGYDWTYISVEDVPFLVRAARVEGDVVRILLSDDSSEELDPESLELGAQGALYVRVKLGRFVARFTPEAQTALGPLLREKDGDIVLETRGGEHAIRARAEAAS